MQASSLAASAGLPPLPALPAPEMRGPTPWSNWVIRGHVLAGAFPGSLDDAETERILTVLLELGITTFVCLQAEVDIGIADHLWRAGQGLRPYVRDAQRLLSRARATRNTRIKQHKLDFLHLAIVDGSVAPDTALVALVDDCMGRILAGERLYIHCWGGHGRTGTLVALLLALLYAISADDALRYTQAFHDSRRFPQGVRSPQTAVQRAQVKRVINQATRAATPRDSWGAAAHTTTPGGVTSVVAERHPTTNEAPSLPAPGTPFRPASAAPSSARAWAAATRRPSDVRLPTPPSTAPEQAHQTPSFYSPSTSRRVSLLSQRFPSPGLGAAAQWSGAPRP